MKRKLLIIIRNFLIGLIVLYGVCAIMVEIPPVQRWFTSVAQEQLTSLIGTEVRIGHITIGYPNRFIVDDLIVNDKSGEQMLKAARFSAKMEWMPLLTEGRLSMHTMQMFGFHAHLRRKTPKDEPNYQFLLDAFASTDTTRSASPLNLRINSLLVRRGSLKYDVESEAKTYGKFNPAHLAVENINATINLKSISQDSINATIRRMDFKEQSGFVLKGLQLQLKANHEKILLDGFDLKLPASHLKMETMQVDFSDYEEEHGQMPIRSMRTEIDRQSYLTPSDLAAFVPIFTHFDEPLYIKARFQTDSTRVRIPELDIHSLKREVSLRATDFMAKWQNNQPPYIKAKLEELRANKEGIRLMWENLKGKEAPLPEELQNAGFLQFIGDISGTTDNLNAHGLMESGIGAIQTNATMTLTPDGKREYKGFVGSEGLALDQLLGEEQKIGTVSFNLEFNGASPKEGTSSLYLKGEIPTLQYSGYEYQNINMDGTFNEEGFNGLLALDDPNIAFVINGRMGIVKKVPTFNLEMQIDHFRPYDLKLTNERSGHQYGLKLTAHVRGNNIDNVEGFVNVDSLRAIVPGDTFETTPIALVAKTMENGQKQLKIEADFMKAQLDGDYSYSTLLTSFSHIVAHHMPSIIPSHVQKKRKDNGNRFDFNLKLDESNFYSYILGIPFNIHPTATMKGYINDSIKRLEMAIHTPHLIYNGEKYEGGNLILGNDEKQINTNFNITKHQENGEHLTLMFDAQAKADTLTTQLAWGNDTEVTNAGTIIAHAHIAPRQKDTDKIKADIHLDKSELIINDTIWNVSPAQIYIHPESIEINNLDIGHEKQHLIVNGRISENPDDSLVVDLKRIAVEYILNIVQFDAVSFKGKATGKAIVSNPHGEIKAHTDLHVETFRFNDGLMGDMDVTGWWDNEIGVMLDADIREGDKGRTTVKGYVSPQQGGLNLQIGAQNTNLEFLNSFVGSIFDNVEGRVSGPIHLHGPFKELVLEGDARANAQAHVKILNTPIILQNDSLHLTDTGIEFPNITVRDPEGNAVATNGKLSYKYFKNIGYNFRFNMDNFRFYDTNDFGNMPFYGRFYGSGMVTLWGGGDQLNLNANIETNRNSVFVYNLSTPESIKDNSFVTFVDKTPRHNLQIEGLRLFQSRNEKAEENDGQPLQVAINAAIDVTPDATVRVIMDSRSGDYVEAQGTGTINVAYTNESTDLRGTYIVDGGVYKMSMQDVIRKDFQLEEGSEVTFTGEGGDADLNLKAIHTVNSASLLDLVPDATFNNNTVKVNCIINMTGKLAAPVLDFDLDLPTVNDEERQLVRSAITTDEQMRTQIIYLLGVGKFYTFDYANTDNRTSSNTMTSLLSSTLSGQLNNILSQALNMSNWNFSSNFSTGQEGWSDLEVEGILSGRMLDNRLLFNGNLGYREDQLKKSNFVGDFDLQWLLNQSGEVRVKLYNMTNDRYFAKQTLNTQGVGLIYKRDFNNWADLFRWRKKK